MQAIRNSFPSTVISYCKEESRYSTELNEFSPTSTLELSPLFKTMSVKSCLLDPIPGGLMKDCYLYTILIPVIASIINLSFDNATVPASFKEAVLDPILKKDSLDHEVHKNFRPVSNLRFVSKATEKVVALRLNQHLVNNNLHEMFQSAYRIGHSTETALTRIHNDILLAIDDSSCIILVLLDLSAALDAVDHNILLRLEHRFGITGKALS